MKKTIAFCLSLVMIIGVTVISAFATTLTGIENSWLLITEVAAYPSASETNDFGQLIEVYNNTDGVLDLYNFEFDIVTSRSSTLASQMVRKTSVDDSDTNHKCYGGFFVTNNTNECLLQSQEVGVIRIVFNQSQKNYTDTDVRNYCATNATAIPDNIRIITVDVTDTNYGYGISSNILRESVCYLMANKRGCYEEVKTEQAGAFVRIYGQTGTGKSQLYGIAKDQSNERWQKDITATSGTSDSNVTMAFGTLSNEQIAIFMPDVTTALDTTATPDETTSSDTTTNSTDNNITTKTQSTTKTPTTTVTPASTTTKSVDINKNDKDNCSSCGKSGIILGLIQVIAVAFGTAIFISINKK